MSWFKTGKDGYEDFIEREKRAEAAREAQNGPRRFYIKPGTSGDVTFLDDDGFFFTEHNIKINGKYGNFFTCRADFSECPLCESGDRPSSVAAFTVIDHSSWTSPVTGKTYQNQKKLLIAKQSVVKKLMRRRTELGTLRFQCFRFSRDNVKECSTGEDITHRATLTEEKLTAIMKKRPPQDLPESEWFTPFDYVKLFSPKSVEELRVVAGQKPPIGSDIIDDVSDDSPPFDIFILPHVGEDKNNDPEITDDDIEQLL